MFKQRLPILLIILLILSTTESIDLHQPTFLSTTEMNLSCKIKTQKYQVLLVLYNNTINGDTGQAQRQGMQMETVDLKQGINQYNMDIQVMYYKDGQNNIMTTKTLFYQSYRTPIIVDSITMSPAQLYTKLCSPKIKVMKANCNPPAFVYMPKLCTFIQFPTYLIPAQIPTQLYHRIRLNKNINVDMQYGMNEGVGDRVGLEELRDRLSIREQQNMSIKQQLQKMQKLLTPPKPQQPVYHSQQPQQPIHQQPPHNYTYLYSILSFLAFIGILLKILTQKTCQQYSPSNPISQIIDQKSLDINKFIFNQNSFQLQNATDWCRLYSVDDVLRQSKMGFKIRSMDQWPVNIGICKVKQDQQGRVSKDVGIMYGSDCAFYQGSQVVLGEGMGFMEGQIVTVELKGKDQNKTIMWSVDGQPRYKASVKVDGQWRYVVEMRNSGDTVQIINSAQPQRVYEQYRIYEHGPARGGEDGHEHQHRC